MDGDQRSDDTPTPVAGVDETTCAVCAEPLLALSSPGSSEALAYIHVSEAPGGTGADHPAVPVGRDQVQTALRCDLCLAPNPTWIVPTAPFTMAGADRQTDHGLGPLAGASSATSADMLACEPCARLVRKDRWADLGRRVVLALAARHSLSPAEPRLIEAVGVLHGQIREHRNGPVRRAP